jgi:hypothetical protein
MQRGSQALRDQRGMALMMAIVITAICAVITTGLIRYIISEYQASHLDWRKVQALYAAEAGVEQVIEMLGATPDLTGDVAVRSLADDDGISGAEGEYEATVSAVESNTVSDPMGAKRIVATGYVPTKQAAEAGEGVKRRIVVIYSQRENRWDFGMDAVRARKGIRYGSNDFLTVVVDTSYTPITDESVDASLRVTGIPLSEAGPDDNAIICDAGPGSNSAQVSGTVTAPGRVDIATARSISSNNLDNLMPDAFPPPDSLGYVGTAPDREAAWPPPAGSWMDSLYLDSLSDGQSYTAATVPSAISGSAFIDMGSVRVPIQRANRLENVTMIGPGTVFVRGHLGGGIVNGYPPVTLVVLGEMNGNFDYTCNGPPDGPAPPLIIFGKTVECQGNATWKLNGPLMALHPDGEVNINDSAMLCFGAIVANGIVDFKSNNAVLGYPQWFANQKFEMVAKTPPGAISYSFSYSAQ